MRNVSAFKIVFAFGLIALGVLLILTNIGVISLEIGDAVLFVYPFLFIIIGLKWIFDKSSSWQAGTFLLIFGGLLALDRFGYIDFAFWDVWNLWPLILVFIGISIFSPTSKKPTVEIITDKDTSEGTVTKRKKNFTIGDHHLNQPNWTVEPMDLWNAIGDFQIDFTKAFIPEKNTHISVGGIVGDVKIIMPENVAFKVDASIKTGGIMVLEEKADGINRKVHYKTPDYDDAIRKITLSIDLAVGDIRVDKV